QDGLSGTEATQRLSRLSVPDKNELLFTYGVNFNDLPLWQKRGIGLYWKQQTHEGFNPLTQQTVSVMKKQLFVDMNLPIRDDYNAFIRQFVLPQENQSDAGER
ncbi:MAG: guanylyltransferase, partial [Flavobacterium sp.]